jgi:hypothetical protein
MALPRLLFLLAITTRQSVAQWLSRDDLNCAGTTEGDIVSDTWLQCLGADGYTQLRNLCDLRVAACADRAPLNHNEKCKESIEGLFSALSCNSPTYAIEFVIIGVIIAVGVLLCYFAGLGMQSLKLRECSIVCNEVGLLVWKNWLLKKRFLKPLLMEILTPPVLLSVMVALKLLFPERQSVESVTLLPQLDPIPVDVTNMDDSIYGTILPAMPVYCLMAFAKPVPGLTAAVVREKELKFRYAMKTMGVSDTALTLSWNITYLVIYAAISFLTTILLTLPIFPGSESGFFANTSIVELFFFLLAFGLGNTAYCQLVSVFFDQVRRLVREMTRRSVLYTYGPYSIYTFTEICMSLSALDPPSSNLVVLAS